MASFIICFLCALLLSNIRWTKQNIELVTCNSLALNDGMQFSLGQGSEEVEYTQLTHTQLCCKKHMVTSVSSNVQCAATQWKACRIKIRSCSWSDSLIELSAFVFFFWFRVGWVVQLCQWHLSYSGVQSSHPPILSSGPTVPQCPDCGNTLSTRVGSGSSWLRATDPVPAQLWCLHAAVCGKTDKRTLK